VPAVKGNWHFSSLGEEKGSKRYRIELSSSVLVEKAFERWQWSLNLFKTSVFMVGLKYTSTY